MTNIFFDNFTDYEKENLSYNVDEKLNEGKRRIDELINNNFDFSLFIDMFSLKVNISNFHENISNDFLEKFENKYRVISYNGEIILKNIIESDIVFFRKELSAYIKLKKENN